MPNTFAYFALLIWPIIAIFLYKKLDTVSATFSTILGGYLFLPVKVAIDLPLIPALDKVSISSISAFLCCIYIHKLKISLIPKDGLEKLLISVLLFLPFINMLNNQEPVFNGEIWIPGLTFHDSISSTINQYLGILPFILGLQVIKSHAEQLQLFKLLTIAGLVYSVFILFEIRFSPQLHTWVYGFFPHDFGQTFKFGGYRAVVFIGHGLLVAMFIAISLGAACLLSKNKVTIMGLPAFIIAIYFLILLALSKSVGPFMYGITMFLFFVIIPNFAIIRFAKVVMLIVVLYPTLSTLNIFPHQEILDYVVDFDANSAQSLGFRWYHEDLLLRHAHEKILTGWGGWGRNRFFDSVTDGYWIIMFGIFGVIGFIALYGLSILSVWRGAKSLKFSGNEIEKNLMIGHILIVAIIMVDTLPNASMTGWLWFLIGALLGRTNSLLQQDKIA